MCAICFVHGLAFCKMRVRKGFRHSCHVSTKKMANFQAYGPPKCSQNPSQGELKNAMLRSGWRVCVFGAFYPLVWPGAVYRLGSCCPCLWRWRWLSLGEGRHPGGLAGVVEGSHAEGRGGPRGGGATGEARHGGGRGRQTAEDPRQALWGVG